MQEEKVNQTSYVSDFSGKYVIPLPANWTTWTSNEGEMVKTQYGFHLRQGDYLHRKPDGGLVIAKTPKESTPLSHFIQAQHELLGNYVAGDLLQVRTAQTFVIKTSLAPTGLTIGSFASTSWTVQRKLDEKENIIPSDITEKDELKKNWAARIVLHDPDANPGHICLIIDNDRITPYFIDYAPCFTGYNGENYQVAINGLGNTKQDTWGHELIVDYTDSAVIETVERAEFIDMDKLEQKSREIGQEILNNFAPTRDIAEAIEEDRKHSLEIVKYRCENLRAWVKQIKPKK